MILDVATTHDYLNETAATTTTMTTLSSRLALGFAMM